MSLYRCAACGSPNVVKDRQSAGIKYDYVKGAVGTLALGVGGAAAGITNNTADVFVCPDCGARLTEPMPESIKSLIEIGLLSKEARDHLSIGGAKLYWDTLKQQYKNIGEGVADQIASDEKEAVQRTLTSGTASKQEFDAAWETIVHYAVVGDAFESSMYDKVQVGEYTGKNPISLKEYNKLCKAIHVVAENAPNYIPIPLSSEKPGPYPEAWWLLKGIIAEYVFLQFFEFTGCELVTPFYGPKNSAEGIANYLEINPYIIELENYYDLHWTLKSDSSINRVRSVLRYALLHKTIYIELNKPGSYKGTVWLYFPKFKIENGHLYFNNLSFKHSALNKSIFDASTGKNEEFEIIKADYYKSYPEQQNVFDQMLSSLIRENVNSLKESNEKIEKEADSLRQEIANLKESAAQHLKEAKSLAESGFLGRGKVKYKDRIGVLCLQAEQKSKKVDQLSQEISELQKQMNDVDELGETVKAYATVISAMDYLMVWQEADDKPAFEDEEKAPEKDKQTIEETVLQTGQANFCANCGVKLLPNTRFCPSCGKPIVGIVEENLEKTQLAKEIESGADEVEFGRYPQTKHKGKEPLQWIILKKEDDRALLLCKKLIDSRPYNEKCDKDVNWKTSDLRTWLNSTFIDAAFSEQEKGQILLSETDNKDSEHYYVTVRGEKNYLLDGGKKTSDKVFLLSMKEFNSYLSTHDAFYTEYAEAHGIDCSEEGISRWWTRTRGWGYGSAVAIYPKNNWHPEGVEYYVDVNDNSVGVRPAMWVKL